jgi:hypothetical protein
MVTRRRAATVVGVAGRHVQRAGWVVVAGAPHDHPADAGEGLAPVVGPIRVRAQRRRRPLAQIAEQVLHPMRAGALGAGVAPLGGVVAATEDRQRRRRRGCAPGVWPLVVASRGLLPLGFGRQPPLLPRAVVAGPEPRDLDGRMVLQAGIGHPQIRRRGAWAGLRRPTVGRGTAGARHQVDARVGVVRIVPALGAGARDTAGIEERGKLRVRHLVPLDPEIAHVDAMQRPLLGRAVVATQPDAAGRHEHEAVGDHRQPRGECQQGDGHERYSAGHSEVCNTGAGEYTPTPVRLMC